MKSRSEYTLVLLLFTVLLGFLGSYKSRTWIHGHGDNAFLADLTRNIATTGLPLCQVCASIKDYFDRPMGKSAAQVCEMNFKRPDPIKSNYFKWHPYIILYLVAPLVWLTSPVVALSWVTALSFVSLLFGVYFLSRKLELGVVTAAAVTLFVASHPAWAFGIQGQLYVDRWVLGLGFWFMVWLAYYRNSAGIGSLRGSAGGVTLSLLLMLTSDRYGFMVGALMFGYFLLFPRDFRWPRDVRWLVVGLFGFFLTFVMINYYIEYALTAAFIGGLSLAEVSVKLLNPDAATRAFFLLNWVLCGVFALSAPRYLLLAIGLMLPNLLGTVGGSEKVNYLTHYHSMYFPVLAFAMTVGIAGWMKRLQGLRWSIPLLVVCGVIVNLGTWRSDNTIQWSVANLRSNPLVNIWAGFTATLEGGGYSQRLERLVSLTAAVKEDSVISTTEAYLPAFGLEHEVHLFPIAFEQADYLVLPIVAHPGGGFEYRAIFSFNGEEDSRAQERCLIARAKQLGFDFERAQLFGDVAIITRARDL